MPDGLRILGGVLLLAATALLTSACGEDAGPTLTVESDPIAADRTDVDAAGEERITRRRSGGTVADHVQDAQLEARVLIALSDESRLSAYPFMAEVVAGEVVLSGNVGTQNDQRHAIQIVQSVEGVNRVVNGITYDEPTEAPGAGPVDGSTNGRAPESAAATEAAPTAAYHTVSAGESLWTISRQHGVSIDDIRRLNSIQGNNVRPGQRLRVR